MKVSKNDLKKIVLQSKILSPAQIKEAEELYGSSKEPFDQILVNKKFITEKELTKLYAESIGVPYIDLAEKKVPHEVLTRVPERIAKKYQTVLFEMDADRLHLAMSDPEDIQAADFLEKQLGKKVKVYAASPTDISNLLEQYKGGLETEVGKAIKESGIGEDEKTAEELETEIEESSEDAPISKTVSIILEYAKKSRASDIHIEPRGNFVQVRYRIDGVLHETMTLPKTILQAIITRIKILANLKIDEHRLPQDGRFKIKHANATVAIRVSILPVTDGEKVVMRLLEESTKPLTLEELGFAGRDLEIIKRNIKRAHGLTLVTGPTGAGKSTTLYSILSILNTAEVNISTVEDPVEYKIPGVNQTQVNPKIGMTFATGLRSLLRQDPNIIMVGEIRDSETGDLAVQAALTGHVVLSTLHTNNAATTLPRLLDMKIEPFLIASTVNTVIAQRLVRKLCPFCKVVFIPDQKALEQLKQEFDADKVMKYRETLHSSKARVVEEKAPKSILGKLIPTHKDEDDLKKDNLVGKISEDPNIKVVGSAMTDFSSIPEAKQKYSGSIELYRAKGCAKCDNKGYLGRIGIYEVLEVTETIGRMILEHASAGDINKQAVTEGMITIGQDGFIKALDGLTTIDEVLRVTKE